MTTVRSGNDGTKAAAASTRTSIPLRGTSRLTLSTRGPVTGKPERGAHLGPLRLARGRNRSVSTPGGTSTMTDGEVRFEGARPPVRPFSTTRRASAAG